MKPLIEIQTVPIEIEMKTTHARMEFKRGTAEMELSRDKGGLSIKSRPIRVNIDTFEARNSITPTAVRSIEQGADRGVQAAYEATASYARHGQLFVEAQLSEDTVAKIAQETQTKAFNADRTPELTFLPSTGPEITWQEGHMDIHYEMDKLNFDWQVDNGNYEFIPGDIEFLMTQRPDVIIKYVGDPIYVPPSASPNYEPVDVDV